MKLIHTLTIPQFPTHIAKTANKTKDNKMFKINNQAIYNGALNKFQRAIVVENLHNFMIEHINKAGLNNLKINKRIVILYQFRTVINHGDISWRKGKICWKPAVPNYEPTWDINNIADLWTKIGNDSFSLAGTIVDDNVRFVRGTYHSFIECKDIDERELKIFIYDVTSTS